MDLGLGRAIGVDGNTEVGCSYQGAGTPDRACLWHGTAASRVDLDPGFPQSFAGAVSGNIQVGSGGDLNGGSYALEWTGSAASCISLHSYLNLAGLTDPRGNLFPWSTASGVDASGNVVGTVHSQTYMVNGAPMHYEYAVMWKAIRTVAGTANLQNYSMSPAGTQITVELRAPGTTTALDTHVVALDGSGNFSFTTDLPPGTYDVAAKGSHWLRQRLSNQTVGVFGVSGLSYSLINGDVNGDNVVSLADFGQLRAAFGSSSGSGNWNPNADLNGDGVVSLADFGILRSNFGQQGDP